MEPLKETMNLAVEEARAYGTDEDIKAKRETLERNKVRNFKVALAACVTLPLLLVWAIFAVKLVTPIPALFLFSLVVLRVEFVSSHLEGSKAGLVIQKYTPLAESSKCFSALQLVERSPAASSLRDTILDSGRQLYVFDLDLMARVANAEEKTEEALRAQVEARQNACAQLHRLA